MTDSTLPAPSFAARLRTALLTHVSLAMLAGGLAGLAAPGGAQTISTPPDYLKRQLSPSGEPGSSVRSLPLVDRRGEWIAFVGDIEDAGAEAVYAIRRNGSALHRLSPYANVGSIEQLGLTADGRGVFYYGDLEVEGRKEIWSAPFWGTPASAVKLNLPVAGVGVWLLVVGPEPAVGSAHLVYLAMIDGELGFWSVPTSGPASAGVRVDPQLEATDDIYGLYVTGPPERFVLAYFDDSEADFRVWSMPAGGPAGSGVFLSNAAPAGCTTELSTYSASAARLAFTHTCPTANGPRKNQLWSVPFAGPATAAISLGGSFVTGGEIRSPGFAPEGDHIVFSADKLTVDKVELWSVPFAGPAGALVRLSLGGASVTDVTAFAIAPDDSRVAYISDPVVNEQFHAYSVPIGGPSSLSGLLDTSTTSGRDVTDLVFTPDSSQVVFRADFEENDRFDLYRSAADGSEPEEQLTNDSQFDFGRSASAEFALHPDGKRVVYIFDEDAPGDERGLGEQKLLGSYFQDARLNQEPVAGGTVAHFEVFPDSAGTLYLSDQDVDSRYRIYVADSRVFGDGFEDGTTSAWPDDF
jgi:hypothetical protein